MEMLFNNYLITQLINITNVSKSPIGEQIINSIAITGRNGEIFQNRTLGTKSIEVEYYLKADYRPNNLAPSEFQKVVKALAFYLTNNDAPAKLIFSDDPKNYYLAMVESFDIERLLSIGQGKISFKCFSPYTYSLEPKFFTDNNGTLTLENKGTASTYPTFSITLGSKATHLSVISPNGVVQIGNPNGIHEGVSASNSRIHWDNSTSAEKIYQGSSSLLVADRVIESDIAMISDGYAIRLNADPQGEENSGKYHGQFYMTNLDKLPTNKYWSASVYFTFSSRQKYDNATGSAPEQQGIIEFTFYDQNNTRLGTFSMRDYYDNFEHNIPFWYAGDGTHLWSEKGTLGATKNKVYSQHFDSLSDVPENATILSDFQIPKYKITTLYNGTPFYTSNSVRSKQITKLAAGSTFEYKTETRGWYAVYANSEKTQVWWVESKHCTKESDGTITSVTYSVPVNGASQGNWNDFTGNFTLERIKHSNGTGSIWRFSLHKRVGTDSGGNHSPVVHSFYKNIYDPEDKYCFGGKLAKVGIFIGTYQNAPIVKRATYDGMIVRDVVDSSDFNGDELFKYIGDSGDTIIVNCEEQMVYKNGVEFMDMVDVGSEFFDIPAYTSSQVKIITDATSQETTAEIIERSL